MPFALINLIPDVSTGLVLIAFVCAVVAWIYYRKMVDRQNLVASTLRSDRFKALKALLLHFDINTDNLTPRQQFSLAAAQIRLRRIEHCRRTALGSLCVLLLSVVSIYAIDKSGSGPQPETQTAADKKIETRAPVAGADDVDTSVVKLPFAVRLISSSKSEEELPSEGRVTIANWDNPIPNKITRDGGLFVLNMKETERTTLHILASLDPLIERTLVFSGYTASQLPCDRRVIHLLKNSFMLNDQNVAVALKTMSDTTHCESVDKALVVWNSLREAVIASPQSPYLKSHKNARTLVEYNWARGNYQACVTLGYEQQCEIGKRALEKIRTEDLQKVGISEINRDLMTEDMNSLPLQIAYARVRNLFEAREYLTAVISVEELIASFEQNDKHWQHINISKSRLYTDAAVSWMHFGDSLTSSTDAGERTRRCEAYDRALFDAGNVLLIKFRQSHVPPIEKRAVSCRQGLQRM